MLDTAAAGTLLIRQRTEPTPANLELLNTNSGSTLRQATPGASRHLSAMQSAGTGSTNDLLAGLLRNTQQTRVNDVHQQSGDEQVQRVRDSLAAQLSSQLAQRSSRQSQRQHHQMMSFGSDLGQEEPFAVATGNRQVNLEEVRL